MRALPGRELRSSPKSPPPSITRDGAHADQRRRILRAVGDLVGERGYGEVTVELIVKHAHVSFKTFYKHFAGKEECLLALCEDTFDSSEAKIRERLAAEPTPWPEQVVLVLRSLFELIVAEPLVARAVIVESPTVSPAITARYEQATKALVPLFRAGRGLNPRGGDLPETIEETLAGSVFWAAYQRLIVGEAEQLPASLPVLLELVLRTYIGQAEASQIARAEAVDLQPALA
ncbi:MAG TPA: TetR/AcrR family transcriptional regulator [Solirubrobacterales bacterium]|nr:TetR/AcrR family transcriptional regulator [Solirubrobacterales bacterium]